jgi:hypothetical protein
MRRFTGDAQWRRLFAMKMQGTSGARSKHFGSTAGDPALTPCVTASIEEIRQAQRLRERLRARYPDRPSPRAPYWSVGAD